MITVVSATPANAVVVTATGTNPSVCDQVVNDATGVSATRLSGGDCVVQFSSTAVSYQWTAPANLYSVTYLVVGGGGSGGTGWDSTGAAGGANTGKGGGGGIGGNASSASGGGGGYSGGGPGGENIDSNFGGGGGGGSYNGGTSPVVNGVTNSGEGSITITA